MSKKHLLIITSILGTAVLAGCKTTSEDVCKHRAKVLGKDTGGTLMCSLAIGSRKEKIGPERYQAFLDCSMAATDRNGLVKCEKDSGWR